MDFRYDSDELTILSEARQTLRRFLPRERFFHGSDVVGDWASVAAGGWLHAVLPEEDGGAGLPLHIIAGVAKDAGALLAGDAFVNNAVIIPRLLAASAHSRAALGNHGAPPGFIIADGRSRSLTSRPSAPTPWCFGVEGGFCAYSIAADAVHRHDRWEVSLLGRVAVGVGEVAAGPIDTSLGLDVAFELPAEALIVHAATLVGLGESALNDTTAYVLERNQFGGPIGRFQAIKHELADIATELEIAWNAVLFASLRPEDDAVLAAEFQAARTCLRAARAMTQFFGGIGVTIEHHAQLVLKMAATSAVRFGSPESHAEALGRQVLGVTTR